MFKVTFTTRPTIKGRPNVKRTQTFDVASRADALDAVSARAQRQGLHIVKIIVVTHKA